jgi:hypothetical protein
MNIFKGLNAHQAVKLDNGKFVVALPRGNYVIDAAPGIVNGLNDQVVVADITRVFRVENTPGEILHYTLNDQIVSVEVRNALYAELQALHDKYFSEYTEVLVFTDLDTEFDFRKKQELVNRHILVRGEPQTLLIPVEITVIGIAEDTGSEFIETPFTFGEVSFQGRGVYRVNLSDIAKDEFNKAVIKYTEATFNNATHSNIRFAQVNGDYLFKEDTLGAKENQARVFGSLKEAQAMEQNVRTVIGNILRHKLEPVKVTQNILTVNQVLADLAVIKREVVNIDSKSKTVGERRHALAKLNALIDKLEQV